MKIIFLNAWRAELEDKIRAYLSSEVLSTDVFCLQEVDGGMRDVAEDILSEFNISSAEKDIVQNDRLAVSNFFKKEIDLQRSDLIIEGREELGLGLFSQIKIGNELINLGNIHGLPRPGPKLDTTERIEQSEQIIGFFETLGGRKIIGGDFNLLPDQKSITMFEDNGYIDLIKKYKIETTRNKHAWEKYPETVLYHSDYLFVSPDVKVKSFEVPDIEVSDHLPLVLEIED